ncbi:MAG TPA: zinc ABC transporter substrate-binding protein, partial [Thermoanaerobaculia bacterium]|nr:zinc ABC transporter substrate-binding protein [Thermoanaerobaculia bacterium]
MKKTILLASLALAAALPATAAVQVVTSIQDFASITESVGGKRVEAFSLSRGYQDPHFVEAKPSFILKLSRADLLIVAGLELEIGYLPPLLEQSRNEKIRPGAPGYLDASIGCDILERPTGTVTRAMGDVHPFGNPHY